MATTYDRLRAGLQHAKRRKNWGSLHDLVQDILDRKVAAFRRSGDSTGREEYLQAPTVRTILNWGRTFGSFFQKFLRQSQG